MEGIMHLGKGLFIFEVALRTIKSLRYMSTKLNGSKSKRAITSSINKKSNERNFPTGTTTIKLSNYYLELTSYQSDIDRFE